MNKLSPPTWGRKIATYLQNICKLYIYDKGCVTKIYREILKLRKKMTSKPIKKLGKLFSYSFDQISTVIIKKLQKRKKPDDTKCWQSCREN